jgi:FkbM family methyltransferase
VADSTDRALTAVARNLVGPLGIADIGCRWGFADVWGKLGDSVRIVGFDPDAEECVRLRDRYAGRPGVDVIDVALASHVGARTIHRAAEPACSSFYAPDPIVLEHVPELSVIAPMGVTTTDATTLDLWCEETNWGTIDFVKADVQGAEHDVLLGATSTLANVVLMELEVEFNPIYAGQPLFADVDALARDKGFRLWRLSNLAHYTRDGAVPHGTISDTHFCDSRPVTWDSPGGQLYWGHATYVAEDVLERSGHDWQRPLRAGCLASALGLHDLALHAWVGAARIAPERTAADIAILVEDYSQSLTRGHAG